MTNFINRYKDSLNTLKAYSVIESIQLILCLVFVSTITLNTRMNSGLLIAFLFFLLFTFNRLSFIKNLKPILIFTSIFLISVLTIPYSSNTKEAWLVIERQLVLLLVPFLFFSAFKLDPLKFKTILITFYTSIFLISLYLIKVANDKFTASQQTIKEWFVRENLYHSFAQPIGMHATYLSLCVALSIFIGLYYLLLNRHWLSKLVILFTTLTMVITLGMLTSRIVIVTLVVIVFFVYPFYTDKFKNRVLMLIAGISILLILFSVIRESSFISNRFLEKIDDEVKLTPFLKADSTYNPIYGGEARADRWFCAIELIKERPVLGYGTGSEKEVLMQKYHKYNLQNAIENNYDAHNQYLAFFIKSGILGILCFLMIIFYGFYIAYKSKNFLYLSFMILFSVTCITENVLESNKGIFFFAFFNAVFCSYLFFDKKRNDQKQN